MPHRADWTLIPREGLGRLKFGMSAAAVDVLSETYGGVTARMNDRVADDILRDTLEQFGGEMTDEEKQALIAVYAELGPSESTVTETRGEPGLILRYDADRLVEIMPARGQRPLFLGATDLLGLTASDALILLQDANGGPGRYAATEAAFDELAVSVDGFSVTDGNGVRALDDADERFRERTVLVRATPYRPETEMHRFVEHRF